MTEQMEREQPQDATGSPVYVYGIVPADVEVNDGARGVGDPPAPVRLVRCGTVGALISDIDPDQPVGRPADLYAHQRLLDGVAGQTPVLPLRFGAVLTGTDAVTAELLDPNHDDFAAALDELDGRIQFVVKGQYVDDALLREVLAENPEAGRLREEIASIGDPMAAREPSIQLGEIVNSAITEKREVDTRQLLDAIDSICVATGVRPATDELDAAHVAVLVDVDRRAELEDALGDLGQKWSGRVELRLLGPMAPYDFVVAAAPEGE